MIKNAVRHLALPVLSLFLVLCAGNARAGADRLTEAVSTIDNLILEDLKAHDLSPNPRVDDQTFVRRVYLDAIGRIPTAVETAAFMGDTASDKRARLIDRLLASDGYRSHMFNWLADMLRVKNEYNRVGPTFTFHTWLKEQLKANRPWDGMVRDMLTASGRIGESGPTGYLLRDAGMPLDSLSNTLTLFLGANVACAQCHDHPFANWTQAEFYEMASFFGTTRFERDDPRKPAKKMGDKEFSKANLVTLLRPNMARVEHEPGRWLAFPDDYQYDDAKPGDRVDPLFIEWVDTDSPTIKPRLKHPDQLRKQFADWMVSPKNPRFAMAIANRLWKRYFGRAVREPVGDLDEIENATNPKLLVYLDDLMKRQRFDLRAFQRVILNTQAYQRQASPTPEVGAAFRFAGPLLRRMSAEQAWDSALVLIRGQQIDRINTDHADSMKRLVLPGAFSMDPKSLLKHRDEIFAFARTLKPSTSKQSKRVKKDGVSSKGGRGMFMKIERSRDWRRASEEPQPQQPDHFLRIAGQSARNVADDGSTEGGITESLAFMNGSVTEQLISTKSYVMQQVARQRTDKARIDLLYQSFLSRPPTATERALASKAIKTKNGSADLAWALLNSREFMFIQ